MSYNKLPADPTALILGIGAILIGFAGCCCYGVFAIVPLALGIIGLVIANKSLKAFEQDPEAYNHQSRSNVATAKILNIIAIAFNAVVLLFFVAAVTFFGTLSSQDFYEEILKQRNTDDFEYEWENDTIYDYEEDDYYEIESDSINIDSIQIKNEKLNTAKTAQDSLIN
ncbi:CCC motif membrane protein [uncultured Psychroserpens sp.]|uniref:CCC motif membrane protein n=1 Tax=uncultured Psychroserpens sp. TaxID=255436 RepID=UPI002630B813|nr:CCC motif membrane protein [uncultured Psychroserpens sp.]